MFQAEWAYYKLCPLLSGSRLFATTLGATARSQAVPSRACATCGSSGYSSPLSTATRLSHTLLRALYDNILALFSRFPVF